jgi:hypothetical protein
MDSVIGEGIGCRPRRRSYRLPYDNLVGNIKNNDRLANDLRINAGNIRIGLTVDLL